MGELAVDALISSLGLSLLARLDDENVMPVVGNDAFSEVASGVLATALELYGVPETATEGTYVRVK